MKERTLDHATTHGRDDVPPDPVLHIGSAEVFYDGLGFDAAGNLYVACYEPSQLMRATPGLPGGRVEVLIRDPEAHLFCHPTNLAFRDNTIFTTNLGRWHLTALDVTERGLPLYGGYGSGR